MAKAAQTDTVALEALSALLADPAPRVMHGSSKQPGVFNGAGAAMKAAACACLGNRWLEPTGDYSGKGKTRKELYRLTAAGLQAVLERSDPHGLLENLGRRLDKLHDDGALLPAKVAELSSLVSTLQHGIQQSADEMRAALRHAEERLKPPDLDYVRQVLAESAPQTPATSPAPAPKSDWTDEALRLIAEQKQRHVFQRLTLPQLYQQLKTKLPHLPLGEFHDGLRSLHEQGRIRLGPYTQALATLDDPRIALYLDREVKYYVELA
jgi:hypothetical protein